jgi:2',3'-cyclic-nucleotide 2'-phosphodiesterase (5'-nucleotidase family)
LDAGNSLTGDRPPANTTQGASTIEHMNMMQYDAMTLGQSDLRLGQNALTSRMAESDFPFLSANAVLSTTGELIASAFITREIDGHRIVVIGVTGNWDPNPVPAFRILDPLATAQRLVEGITSQADIIILLSSAGNPSDMKIAESVPEIDLIVEGGQFQSSGRSYFHLETNTLLVHTEYSSPGHAGRNLGKTTLTFDDSGELIDQEWQLISLDPSISDDPEMARWRQTK